MKAKLPRSAAEIPAWPFRRVARSAAVTAGVR